MRRQTYPSRCHSRGIAAIVGVLLMVGILYTTVIPLFLYVNQVNNSYDKTVVDMKTVDQERSMEKLEVHAFGHNSTTAELDVFIISRCSIATNITRIWMVKMDLERVVLFDSTNHTSLPLQVNPSHQGILHIPPISNLVANDTYKIEVTTHRANKYAALTNPVKWTGTQWYTSVTRFEIEIIVETDKWGSEYYNTTIQGQGSHFNYTVRTSDPSHGNFFTILPVPFADMYEVTVYGTKGQNTYEVPPGKQLVSVNTAYPIALVSFYDRK